MAKNAKSKLEKLVAKVPVAQRNARRRIDTNLYYDFRSGSYYYCLGKDENRKNVWHVEADPIEMENYIQNTERIGPKNVLKKSFYFRNITVEEYLSDFLKHHCNELSKSTKIFYRTCFRRITDEDIGIGNILASELTTDDVKAYLAERAAESSFSTMEKDFNLLKMAYEQAVAERKLTFNPVPAAKIKQGNQAKLRAEASNNITYFSKEEARKITEICLSHLTKNNKFNNEDPNNIYAWGILISLWTGMRRGEVLGLKFSNIHTHENGKRYFKLEKARTLQCEGTDAEDLKTKNAYRNCAFTPEIEKLVSYIEQKYETDRHKAGYTDNGFIIAYSNGTLPNVSAYTKGCQHFLEENGIENALDFHSLRHTFATLLINSRKVAPYELYKLMGHSSFKTTEKYYIGKDDSVDFGHLNAIGDIIAKK